MLQLLVSYAPLHLSCISTQFFVLNLDGWFDVLSNDLLLFGIALLYYNDLNSSIIWCPFPGDIHLSFGISFYF